MTHLADVLQSAQPIVGEPVAAIRGTIANTPADVSDDLYVTVLAFDGRRQTWGPCRWVPSNALPAKGDECLLVLTEEDQTPWAITTAPVYGTGEPGPQGPAGPQGDVGPQGPAGAAGVGVPQPVVDGEWIKGVGGAAVWSPIASSDIGPSAINGYVIKTVGGVALWEPLGPADVGLPKATRGAFASGPPASPAVGDRWVATGLQPGASQTVEFEWTGSYWANLGGAWTNASISNGANTPAGGYSNVPGTGAYTLARAGTYKISVGFAWYEPAASPAGEYTVNVGLGVTPNTLNASYVVNSGWKSDGVNPEWHSGSGWVNVGLGAGSSFYVVCFTSVPLTTYQTQLEITPLLVN